MKIAYSAAAAVLAALLASACQRETTTAVTTVPPATQEPVASSAPAGASAPYAAASSSTPGPAATSVDYNQALEHLQQAGQRLRESTQAMSKEPAGDRRNQAIREAHDALLNANSAMSQLYRPELGSAPLSAGSTGTTAGVGGAGVIGGRVYPNSDADYSAAMEKLMKAAQHFREAIQSMAQLQPGPQRDQAIKDAQQALLDTNAAMIQMPPEVRTEKK